MRKRKSIRSLSIALALIFSFALIPSQQIFATDGETTAVETTENGTESEEEAAKAAEEAAAKAAEEAAAEEAAAKAAAEEAAAVEAAAEEAAAEEAAAAEKAAATVTPDEEPADDSAPETLMSIMAAPMAAVEDLNTSAVLDYFSINDFHGTVDDSASSSNPGIARLQTYLLD